MDYKAEIVRLLEKETKQKGLSLEIPPDTNLGDYAFPCFVLSKVYKKNPVQIAQELSQKIKAKFIKEVKANGPYLNFFIDQSSFAEQVIHAVLKDNDYGSSNVGKGNKALIEHTSINPNASPHVGRARNAILGDAIVKLLRFHGFTTDTHYFVNDVGKQIAMLVLGAGAKKPSFDQLLKIYIDINKKLEQKPDIEKEVFALLNKLEQGDAKVKMKFRQIVESCVKGQTKLFAEFGITYDHFDYESDYLWNKETQSVLEKLQKTGKLFKDEEQRLVLNQEEFPLSMKSKVLVLTRSDGTSLYPLRDLAYHFDKNKQKLAQNILVLGEDQKLYAEQVKAALTILKEPAPRVVHYSFVLLTGGKKLSTRRGELVLLEDFMKEARQKAEQEIKKRNKEISEKELEKLSRTIGYGAIKYAMLKVSPDKNVVFDWEKALTFEGDAGPYIQYAYARISSILAKHGKKVDKADYALLRQEHEIALVKLLEEFPEIMQRSYEHLQPHILANYVYSLAKSFNEFYHQCPILQEKDELKKARVGLITAVQRVLSAGLNILGIEAPERM